MSNIDFGFKMLSDALSNLQQSRYRSALGTGLSPMGQDQSQGQGQGQGQGQSPDTISPRPAGAMMDRAKQYFPVLKAAADRYGVPVNYLMGVAAQESSFNPNAKGPTGDYGMFQFTGPTAKAYGLTNPYDVASSADAAARLLRDNYRKTGSWSSAIDMYNNGTGARSYYSSSVGRFASMFSGLGGSGGGPSEAGVAGGGPGSARTTPDTPGTPASSVLQNLLRSRQSEGTPTADAGTTGAGVGAAAGETAELQPGAASEAVSDPDVSVADDQPSPDLVQQFNDARTKALVQAGVIKPGQSAPPLPDAAETIRKLGPAKTRALIQRFNPSPAGAPGAPVAPPPLLFRQLLRSGGQTRPPGVEAASGGPDMAGLGRTRPPGVEAASGGPGVSGLGRTQQPLRPGQDVSGPSPAMGAAGARDEKNVPGSGHPATDPTHPAHGKPEIKKALKANPNDPPAGPPLNENGFFPYHSVWGKGFTLPQLIYNIKKANPGINPAVLAGAIQLAVPMLNAAATENYRDSQETVREQLESMRETSALQREREHEAAATERTDITADTRLKVASSVQAYHDAQLNFGREKFDERIREFAIKDDEAQRSLFDREEKTKAEIEDRRKALTQKIDAQTRTQLTRDLNQKLAERRFLNQQIHEAVVDKIRMATSLNQPDQATQDALTKDEDARAAKAEKEIVTIENQIQKLEAGGNGNSKASTAPVPAESLF